MLIVIVNLNPFGTESGDVNIPVLNSNMQAGFVVRDLLSGDRYNWHPGWNYVSLNPNDLPAHILLIEQ
jgi:starch synthase (maltosyl-transferring)